MNSTQTTEDQNTTTSTIEIDLDRLGRLVSQVNTLFAERNFGVMGWDQSLVRRLRELHKLLDSEFGKITTYKIAEVIEGLKNGHAYERPIERGGVERVTHVGDGRFRHDVSSTTCGGAGGTHYIPISELEALQDRWKPDGWIRT